MAVPKFSLIPLDVWVAIGVNVYLLLTATETWVLIFVGIYGMLCAYVTVQSFTAD